MLKITSESNVYYNYYYTEYQKYICFFIYLVRVFLHYLILELHTHTMIDTVRREKHSKCDDADNTASSFKQKHFSETDTKQG